eukprot:592624-Lingulodinium_polyedra.AAC.1
MISRQRSFIGPRYRAWSKSTVTETAGSRPPGAQKIGHRCRARVSRDGRQRSTFTGKVLSLNTSLGQGIAA